LAYFARDKKEALSNEHSAIQSLKSVAAAAFIFELMYYFLRDKAKKMRYP
jgi:hypothetical protein